MQLGCHHTAVHAGRRWPDPEIWPFRSKHSLQPMFTLNSKAVPPCPLHGLDMCFLPHLAVRFAPYLHNVEHCVIFVRCGSTWPATKKQYVDWRDLLRRGQIINLPGGGLTQVLRRLVLNRNPSSDAFQTTRSCGAVCHSSSIPQAF